MVKEDTKALFNRLASKWKDDTEYISSSSVIVNHSAYQQIIRLGQEVVPLILEDLAKTPDHWFVALRIITGQNPAKSTEAGDVEAIAQAWLKWGRSQGYLN